MLQKRKFQIVSVIALICWLAGFLPGCGGNTDNKQANTKGIGEEIKLDTKDDDYKIIVNSAWVCEASPYGYVTEGSVCFDILRSEKGYIILIEKDGDIISRTCCPKTKLNYWLDMVKYKLSIRDSLIERGKNSR